MGRWSKSSDCWALYSRYSSHRMKGVAIDMVNVHTTRSSEPVSSTREEIRKGASPWPLPNLKPQNPQLAGDIGYVVHSAEQPSIFKQPGSPLGRAIDRLKSSCAGAPRASERIARVPRFKILGRRMGRSKSSSARELFERNTCVTTQELIESVKFMGRCRI